MVEDQRDRPAQGVPAVVFHFDGLDEPLGREVVEKSARFLATIPKEVRNFRPDVVVVDPVSNFLDAGAMSEAEAMLVRLIDLMKSRTITGLFTNLVRGGIEPDAEVGISSIIHAATTLRNVEHNGDRSRCAADRQVARHAPLAATAVVPAHQPWDRDARGHRRAARLKGQVPRRPRNHPLAHSMNARP